MLSPSLPTRPMSWPALTFSPFCTRYFSSCPYTVIVPSACWIMIALPKPLIGPASITVPSPAA